MELHFDDEGSEFSEEGTRAHGMASDCLQQKLTVTEWREKAEKSLLDAAHEAELAALDLLCLKLGALKYNQMRKEAVQRYADGESLGYDEALEEFGELYPEEMYENVDGYLDYVYRRIAEAKERNPDCIIHIEQRVDFSPWVPEGFGTADCIIISDGVIIVIDYKHGKGVYVGVEENEQLLLYALGALNMFRHLFNITQAHLTIYQPRIGNISEWEIGVVQLEKWANRRCKPIAAIVWKSLETDSLDGVEFDPSDVDMCRFCKAKVHCRARADARLEMAKYEKDVALMSDKEVMAVLGEAEHLGKWASDLKAWAQKQAATGKKVLGWKLVAGRSNRKYLSQTQAASVLLMEGYKKEQIYKKPQLLGITDMKALLKGEKRLKEFLGAFIDKPKGKPTLVPESDPRPEWTEPVDASEQGFESTEA